jgi:hypothetical protein
MGSGKTTPSSAHLSSNSCRRYNTRLMSRAREILL